MPLIDHAGAELSPDQAACYLAARLLLDELTTRAGAMAYRYPMTADEIALRAAVERLRRELMQRSGQPGDED